MGGMSGKPSAMSGKKYWDILNAEMNEEKSQQEKDRIRKAEIEWGLIRDKHRSKYQIKDNDKTKSV